MSRKHTVHILSGCTSVFLLARMLAACGNGTSGGGLARGSNDVDSGSDSGDVGIATGSDESGTAPGGGEDREPSDGSPGQHAMTNTDGGGGQTDSGGGQTDGGDVQVDGGGPDGSSGPRDVGSCCSKQSTPGCSNPDLELCVCQKDQSCCTTAWGLECALIVQQKYCQPTVRDCVCGTDAGQWGQAQCCNTDWTSTCDSVATLKCNAAQGCF
jgi:hypothetical protein